MASLLQLAVRQGCRVLKPNILRQQGMIRPGCFISTSKKYKDSATVSETVETPQTSERLDQKEENWMSLGYNLLDREMDEHMNRMVLFFGLTVAIVWGSFILAYMPDNKMRDWSQREAFLELARRQQAGEPLIDKNLIPEDRIGIPSDEELGDFEIVI